MYIVGFVMLNGLSETDHLVSLPGSPVARTNMKTIKKNNYISDLIKEIK